MKYFPTKISVVVMSTILLGSCSFLLPQEPEPLPSVTIEVPILAALPYVGLHESADRDMLFALLGIDPVEVAWCAAFVNQVLADVGIEGTDSNVARSFVHWGAEAATPTLGDIVVFSRPPVDWQGHVGFYVGTVAIDGVEHYKVLGGNQGNSVGVANYPTSRLLSIRTLFSG